MKMGISQEVMAEKVGVTKYTISRWENMQKAIPGDRLDAVQSAYEVSVSELYGEDIGRAGSDETLRIFVPISLPSEEALTGMFAVLLVSAGVPDDEGSLAQALAEDFPAAFAAAYGAQGPTQRRDEQQHLLPALP